MLSESLLPKLLRYKAWANERLYGALAEVPETVLTAPKPIVFGSILRTLNHVYAMDLVWQAHLEGREHGFTTRRPDDCPAFAPLHEMQQAIDAWYLDYAEHLSVEGAEEVLEISFIGGGEARMNRGEILLHAVNHGTYHRGHIGDMLYEASCEPPTTDLPVFLRETGG